MAKKVEDTIVVESNVFVNPFDKGVNYKTFLDAVGSKSVKDYCKNNLTEDQIEWLENDLKHYKQNKN